MALYAIARGRVAFVFAGFGHAAPRLRRGLSGSGIRRPSASGSRSGWIPGTTASPGGNQIAHGLWALATGSIWGSGPGLGSPQSIPAGHTDFVLAAVGEELGFVGVAVVVGLYAILSWRCLRVAARAPGDYTRVSGDRRRARARRPGVRDRQRPARAVPAGRGCHAVSQLRALVDACQLLRRRRRARRGEATRAGSPAPASPSAHAGCRARRSSAVRFSPGPAWVQVVQGGHVCDRLEPERAGGRRLPVRIQPTADRRGATDRARHDLRPQRAGARDEQAAGDRRRSRAPIRKAGVQRERGVRSADARCYPLGGVLFSVLGDWDRQTNWGARNSSFLERDSDARLKGFDDGQRVVERRQPADRRARAHHQARLQRAAAAGATRLRLEPVGCLDAPRASTRPAVVDRRAPPGAGRVGAADRHHPRRPHARRRGRASTSTAARCSRRSAIHGRPRRSTRRRRRRPIPKKLPKRCSTARATGCIRRAPRSSCSSRAPRSAAAPPSRTRRSRACGCRTAASGTSFGAGRVRSGTIRWTRRRTATSTCDTGSSYRATPTSRSWHCGSGLSRSSTPHPSSRSRPRGPRQRRRSDGRCRTPATVRRTCSCRR